MNLPQLITHYIFLSPERWPQTLRDWLPKNSADSIRVWCSKQEYPRLLRSRARHEAEYAGDTDTYPLLIELVE